MSYIRKKAIEGLAPGDTFSVSRTFEEQDVVQFATISRDYNPVHFDERFAKEKKLGGLICHGLLVASLITEIGGQTGWLAASMAFSFKRPVYIGDTIRCDFTITEIDDSGRAKAEGIFTNQDNTEVLHGLLSGFVPGTAEKNIMKRMMAEGDPTNKLVPAPCR